EGTIRKRRDNSLWRITKMIIRGLRAAITGTVCLEEYVAKLKNAGHRLNEPPRRRVLQMARILS
ncbi:IS4 family transposase, partial [Kosakonia cowanii]